MSEETRNELQRIELELNKIESNLNNPAILVFEEFAELRRRLQLDKEEKIGRIKTANGYSVDTQECELDSSLTDQIDEISDQSEAERKKSTRSPNASEKEILEARLHFLRTGLRSLYSGSNEMANFNIKFFQKKLKKVSSDSECVIYENNKMVLKDQEPKRKYRLNLNLHVKQYLTYCKKKSSIWKVI